MIGPPMRYRVNVIRTGVLMAMVSLISGCEFAQNDFNDDSVPSVDADVRGTPGGIY